MERNESASDDIGRWGGMQRGRICRRGKEVATTRCTDSEPLYHLMCRRAGFRATGGTDNTHRLEHSFLGHIEGMRAPGVRSGALFNLKRFRAG